MPYALSTQQHTTKTKQVKRMADLMTTSFRIAIDSLAYGQAGIGRTPEGKVVFVPKTAPGDLVEVELTRETSSYS